MRIKQLPLICILAVASGSSMAAEPVGDVGYCVYANARYSEGATISGTDGTPLRCSKAPTVIIDDGQVQLVWQKLDRIKKK